MPLELTTAGEPATLSELLAEAERRISRLSPEAAWAEMLDDDALLVDIRADVDRERHGIVPGSVHVPRTVLEWRVAPDSLHRNPHVGGTDRRIVLLCDHGCSSVLAAVTLVRLGFVDAGDVIGGFEAWAGAGLPTAPAPVRRRRPGELAGMRGPDLAEAFATLCRDEAAGRPPDRAPRGRRGGLR